MEISKNKDDIRISEIIHIRFPCTECTYKILYDDILIFIIILGRYLSRKKKIDFLHIDDGKALQNRPEMFFIKFIIHRLEANIWVVL